MLVGYQPFEPIIKFLNRMRARIRYREFEKQFIEEKLIQLRKRRRRIETKKRKKSSKYPRNKIEYKKNFLSEENNVHFFYYFLLYTQHKADVCLKVESQRMRQLKVYNSLRKDEKWLKLQCLGSIFSVFWQYAVRLELALYQ